MPARRRPGADRGGRAWASAWGSGYPDAVAISAPDVRCHTAASSRLSRSAAAPRATGATSSPRMPSPCDRVVPRPSRSISDTRRPSRRQTSTIRRALHGAPSRRCAMRAWVSHEPAGQPSRHPAYPGAAPGVRAAAPEPAIAIRSARRCCQTVNTIASTVTDEQHRRETLTSTGIPRWEAPKMNRGKVTVVPGVEVRDDEVVDREREGEQRPGDDSRARVAAGSRCGSRLTRRRRRGRPRPPRRRGRSRSAATGRPPRRS